MQIRKYKLPSATTMLSSLSLAIAMLMNFVPVEADRLEAMSLTTPLMHTVGRVILSLPGKTEFLTVVGVTLIVIGIRVRRYGCRVRVADKCNGVRFMMPVGVAS